MQKYGSSEWIEIGIHDGGLYKLTARLLKAFLHDTVSMVELWHMILCHLHYRSIPLLNKVVTGLPEFEVQHDCWSRKAASRKLRIFEDVSQDLRRGCGVDKV